MTLVIHLPNILHLSLEGAQDAAKMAREHANLLSKRAASTGKTEDHLDAIKAAQGMAETYGTVAALTGHIMATLEEGASDDEDDDEDDDCEGCDDPACPNNPNNKPN